MNGTQSEIRYRQGRIEDCDVLAELIDMASGGTVDYLFDNLVPGMTPVQVVSQNLAQNRPPNTYENAMVAVEGETVAGMALSFPAGYHRLTPEMEAFFPADRMAHMREFFSTRVEESWFLDAIGVFPGHRRQGIGARLMARTKARAVRNGCRQLSLMVFADNESAISLYANAGFRVVRKVALAGNDHIPHAGGCLLMVSDLKR